jgi:hypothetical protein
LFGNKIDFCGQVASRTSAKLSFALCSPSKASCLGKHLLASLLQNIDYYYHAFVALPVHLQQAL